MKSWKQKVFSILCGILIFNSAVADILLLEPNIQGHSSGDIVHAVNHNGVYFLDIQDLSESLKFKFNSENGTGYFLDKYFSINQTSISPQDRQNVNGKTFYSKNIYEKILPIKIDINPLEMQLNVTSEHVLPTTKKNQNNIRRQNISSQRSFDSFENYEFDNRYFSFPVVDFIYRRNENITDLAGRNESRIHGDYYQLNTGLLFAGMDTHATIFADNYNTNDLSDVRARLTMGRTLLDEPGNRFNLVTFRGGDIFGMNNSLFNNGSAGRGITASSFKDLVISADKTIDITGVMSNGWEAELYLNNQLIGFRQGGMAGRYEFKNIPVNYGLNNFKVVLYGPFGETRSEEKRYYSGASPVKSGEFGYSVNAYQADHFLFETNEPMIGESNNITADSILYYGISDYFTLMAGGTSADRITTPGDDMQFGTLGMQLALNGLSVQYNANYGLDAKEFGHHFDAQGNIYIGDIFARYEYYGGLESNVSYFRGRYLKDLFETRLTGLIPKIDVPYFVSYLQNNNHDDQTFREMHLRLSPNFMRYYNFSLENIWRNDDGFVANELDAMLQATYGKTRIHAKANYQTHPSSYLRDYGAFLEYRWDRNTFFQTTWTHDCRSEYTDRTDIDRFTFGIGRLFSFGGITVSTGLDTDRNLSFGLTYNTSFGKIPDTYDPFINSETQMANYGTIYARVRDDRGAPVENVRLFVNGRESASVTDASGDVLITNLESYQKSIITIDEQDVDDLSLIPEFSEKKLVLRPGALRTVDVPFTRRGGVEGQVRGTNPNEVYKIAIRDLSGELVSIKTLDSDGSFIFDDIAYGDYVLKIYDENSDVISRSNLVIGQSFLSIKTPIQIR